MPRMLYCLPIWGNCSSLSANRLNRALKPSLCTIKSASSVEFTRADFEAYGLMPFEFLLRLKNVCLVHKLLHNEDVSMPTNSFSLSKLNSRSTCGAESYKLKLIKTHRQANKLCFSDGGACDWNALPNNITNIASSTSFKTRVLKFISLKL